MLRVIAVAECHVSLMQTHSVWRIGGCPNDRALERWSRPCVLRVSKCWCRVHHRCLPVPVRLPQLWHTQKCQTQDSHTHDRHSQSCRTAVVVCFESVSVCLKHTRVLEAHACASSQQVCASSVSTSCEMTNTIVASQWRYACRSCCRVCV